MNFSPLRPMSGPSPSRDKIFKINVSNIPRLLSPFDLPIARTALLVPPLRRRPRPAQEDFRGQHMRPARTLGQATRGFRSIVQMIAVSLGGFCSNFRTTRVQGQHVSKRFQSVTPLALFRAAALLVPPRLPKTVCTKLHMRAAAPLSA